MKLLLDNCVDAGVASLFDAHEVCTSIELGWARLQNGELLDAAAMTFDVFVTVDKNIRHQHNLDRLRISILELNVARSRFKELSQLQPWIAQALEHLRTHRFVSLSAGGSFELLAPFRSNTS